MDTLVLTVTSIRDTISTVMNSAALNAVWNFILVVVVYLIGDISGALAALYILMALDIVTRMFCISTQVANEYNINVISGFFLAWKLQRLKSKELATKGLGKFIAYGIGLTMANTLRYGLHDLAMIGYSIASLPRDVVISILCITEAASICENLNECGYTVFGKLGLKFKAQQDKFIKE